MTEVLTPELRLARMLEGIDETEGDSDQGWWETSTGADFGAAVRSDVEALFAEAQSAAWEAGMRHALAWLGLKQYGDVMAKDNPHGRAGE